MLNTKEETESKYQHMEKMKGGGTHLHMCLVIKTLKRRSFLFCPVCPESFYACESIYLNEKLSLPHCIYEKYLYNG